MRPRPEARPLGGRGLSLSGGWVAWAGMQTARARGGGLEVLAVLGVIAGLGLLAAPLPFTGDQALFAAGARQLARGDVLYRDFWDVKQPGIYLWYLGGGSLFRYREVALHLV